jgi:copper ion binding protein
MTCAACAGRVERALREVPGVTKATVNLATERAAVQFDPEATSPSALTEAIEGAGYGVRAVESTLGVRGMTCAACVGRVERALRGVPGVFDATVNLATERATVRHLAGAPPLQALQSAVREAGYEVLEAEGGAAPADAERDAREAERLALRRRLLVAAAFSVPILLLDMGAMAVPPLHDALMSLLPRATWSASAPARRSRWTARCSTARPTWTSR